MTNQLKFGIQTNGIKHTHFDPMPSINERFFMVKETGIFDYVDKTPEAHEIEDFKLASEKYNMYMENMETLLKFYYEIPLIKKNSFNFKLSYIDILAKLSKLNEIMKLNKKYFNKDKE